MSDAFAANQKGLAWVGKFISRSDCAPCDRSEIGHQLATLREEAASLEKRRRILS